LDGKQDHPLLQVIHRRASVEDFDPELSLTEDDREAGLVREDCPGEEVGRSR